MMRRAIRIAILFAVGAAITAAHAESGIIGHAGEWLTRDTDNSHVCQLAQDVLTTQPLTRSFCTVDSWTELPPMFAESISGRLQHWIRCNHIGCQLHFENGWRP
jgi:hypothetical protein